MALGLGDQVWGSRPIPGGASQSKHVEARLLEVGSEICIATFDAAGSHRKHQARCEVSKARLLA